MQFNLESIRSHHGFAGGLVKRQVSWTFDGETVSADVWIRPMSYHTAVQDVQASRYGADLVANRLAFCVCHEDGSPVFRVSDITGLDEEGRPIMVKDENGELKEQGPLNREIADALMVLVGEVSGLGKQKRKSAESENSSIP